MKRTHKMNGRWLLAGCVALLLLCCTGLRAQGHSYTVRNGKMYIQVQKGSRESSLDSFLLRFNLTDIGLRDFFRYGRADSLLKLGWSLEANNEQGFVISKPLLSSGAVLNPADKIIFAEKHPTLAEMFPAVNNGIRYGSNRFRNKAPFPVRDSTVRFFLRGYNDARKVMLAGSFNNWNPDALRMQRTDSGWLADVRLGAGKYWYKFIVDGNWETDRDNLVSENDGRGNINSVYFRPNVTFRLPGYANARNVVLAGSFNNWNEKELRLNRTENGWALPLYLAEGTHTYKFIVDGNWIPDPQNREGLPDGVGGQNSVLRLGKSYLFHLAGYPDARQVVLIGSFNGWKEDELFFKKTATGWELPYTLGPGNYEYKIKVDGRWISDPGNPLFNRNTGNSYLIIAPNYTFRLKGHPNAKRVFLAGDFNNWDPEAFAMRRDGDDWVFRVHLATGKVRYKFVVDGEWIIDSANKLWEQNQYGTGNSILWVER